MDISEIMADDRLLDAIGTGQPVDTSDELTSIFVGWREEITER